MKQKGKLILLTIAVIILVGAVGGTAWKMFAPKPVKVTIVGPMQPALPALP